MGAQRSQMTTAISDLGLAFNDAAGSDVTELGARQHPAA
jgi:hypothetical protein